ncbi:MAG: PAS domain-containing protein [Treponema sp.]|jgi:signal transduction histidine kinase|nr:PAS domain-containing protein [Treponema sp.]
MIDFYRRALDKLDKLNPQQRRELLLSAVEEINLLETVLDSIDVGILVCNEEDNIVLVNKSARRMLPLSSNADLHPAGAAHTEGGSANLAINDEQVAGFFREILVNREKVADREVDVEKAGQTRLLSVNMVPLVRDRKITGSLIYMEDITDKRKVEMRLRRAENLASLTTLAAGVAHDIKNPLGSISIHLQLLQKALVKKNKIFDAAMDKYFKIIKEEINRLNRIVVDFLFAVRPMNLELRMGDINRLLSQIMDFFRIELEQSNILCLSELDESVPLVLMDERFMKQALLNLIKNAQSAMHEGGVLTIATKCADDEVRILICDTGCGISKENLARIFEPYFTTRETGTGLGLTQVFKIIKEHQGEITVDSTPGTGAEFRIILPVPRKNTRMIAYNAAGREKAASSINSELTEGEKNEIPSSCY